MKSVNVSKLSVHLANEFKIKDKKKIEACINKFIENDKTSGVVYVKDYSQKSGAFFGDTKPVWEILKGLNEDKKKVATFNYKLAFGPGIVITGKYFEDVKKALAKKIKFATKSRKDYEKEFNGETSQKEDDSEDEGSKDESERSDESSGEEEGQEEDLSKMRLTDLKTLAKEKGLKGYSSLKKDELIDKIQSEGSKAPAKKSAKTKTSTKKKVATKTKAPPSKAKTTKKIRKNSYGNSEDSDTGIVFLNLPVGENGKKIGIAIGVQNTEAEEDLKGLESVLPLDEDSINECKKHNYKILDDARMKILKKMDSKMHKELEGWLSSYEGEESEDDISEDSE